METWYFFILQKCSLIQLAIFCILFTDCIIILFT